MGTEKHDAFSRLRKERGGYSFIKKSEGKKNVTVTETETYCETDLETPNLPLKSRVRDRLKDSVRTPKCRKIHLARQRKPLG